MTGEFKPRPLNTVQQFDARALTSDGLPLYYGMLHALVGEGESGKTWLAAVAAKAVAEAGNGVLVFDGEMSASTWRRRMESLGADRQALGRIFHVEMSDHAASLGAVESLIAKEMRAGGSGIDLVIWDSALALLTRFVDSENANVAVGRVYDQLREIVREAEVAGLMIDHTTRGSGTLISRGATAKFNALDISFGVRLADGSVPNRETPFYVNVSIEKDRHGILGNRRDRLATFLPLGDGRLEVTVTEQQDGSHRLSGTDPVTVTLAKIQALSTPPRSGNEAHRLLGGNRSVVLAAFKKFQEGGTAVRAGTTGTALKGGYRVPVPDSASTSGTGTGTGTGELVPLPEPHQSANVDTADDIHDLLRDDRSSA